MGYLYIGLIKLIGLVPFAWVQKLGAFVGQKMFQKGGRECRVAKVNIALTQSQLNATQQQEFLHAALVQTGMSGAEMGVMWGASPDKGRNLVRKIHNLEFLTDALAEGKGVLVCVPHLGNWEVLNHIVTLHAPVTAMYQPAKNATLDNWMRVSREKTGGKLVPTTSSGIKAMIRALAKGEVAGILPDQEPDERGGVFAPFLGVETLTPKLPLELLKRSKAPAVFGFAERLADAQGFDVHFFKPDDDIYAADITAAAAGMNRTIERMIKVAPTQYQWTYKRFRQRPDGQANPYK